MFKEIKKKIIKVQIPISAELKAEGDRIAKSYGLSSYQELVRFWTKQASLGNMNLEVITEDELSPEADARYNKMINEAEKEYAAGNLKGFDNVDEMMKYLKTYKPKDEAE